jgi:hypothetical protein
MNSEPRSSDKSATAIFDASALGAWLLATVFGWMHNKTGTLSTLVDNFEQQGITITEQAISKRFTAEACLLLVNYQTENLPLTKNFNGIYVESFGVRIHGRRSVHVI